MNGSKEISVKRVRRILVFKSQLVEISVKDSSLYCFTIQARASLKYCHLSNYNHISITFIYQVFLTWSARKYTRYRTCRSRSVSKTCRLFRVHRVPRVHRVARVRRGARGRCRAGQRHSGRSCVHGEVLEEDLVVGIRRDCTAEERRWDSSCGCELRLVK